MPLQVSRLRRWFAAGAILMVLTVAGAYLYARWRVRNALKEVPSAIAKEVQQSAKGFTFSKSQAGRTLFTIQAGKLVQYKEGGRAELHNVNITLYGQDSSRFDQIYGSDFEYDPSSGIIAAKGEVQIDLQTNPEGLAHPDQAVPKELKNPIHLKTSGLVFNQKTGDAHTDAPVEFQIPQANGSAVGINYNSKDRAVTLQSQIHIDFHGTSPATLTAAHGVITREPRTVLLEHTLLRGHLQQAQADQVSLYLRDDNTLDRVVASGAVQASSQGSSASRVRADNIEVAMTGNSETVRNAVLSGHVQMEEGGPQPVHAEAGRVALDFAGRNQLATVHAEQQVHIAQRQKASAPSSNPQDVELSASAATFNFAGGRHLRRAQTLGVAQIAFRPVVENGKPADETLVTASQFDARFNDQGRIESVHGESNAKITDIIPGQPPRISTSRTLDAIFHPQGGIESLSQDGNVAYSDGEQKAWAEHARYVPSGHGIDLSGSPTSHGRRADHDRKLHATEPGHWTGVGRRRCKEHL